MNGPQQGVDRYYEPNKPVEPEVKPEEKPLTIEDVRASILPEIQVFIDKLVETVKNGFATKADVNSFVNQLSNNINNVQNRIPDHDKIVETAKEAVPGCLRNLDSGGSPRTGPVLTLAPAPAGTAGNADSCVFVPWQAGGITLKGTAALPHLKWNISTEEWEIFLIVPDGTAEAPHLVWNATTGIWEKGLIESDCLPAGGITYQVLQKQSGVVLWDWTRWAVEIT